MVFAGAATVLVACSASLVSIGPPADLYNLTPKSTFKTDLPQVDAQIVVEEPLADGGLDSSRIALRPRPTELKYFAESRWTERSPKMVQTLLVESLENSGRIVSVGRQSIGLRSDYNLKADLREFQAEYYDGLDSPPSVRVRINVKIVQQPRQNIIASRSFEHLVKAKGTGMPAVVDAFDDALGRVMKHITEWTLVTVAQHKSGS
jgi:cholesterol transport system auxiliary component